MDNELGRVVDALPGLVWTALPDGHMDFLNRRLLEYTGLALDAARGQGWQSAVHTDDLPQILERLHTLATPGESHEFEARLRRFDGEYRRFAFRLSPLTAASGTVVKWCGVSIDIEERKRAEDHLCASERRFRMIVDGFPAIVSLRTASGALDFVNRQFVEYSGATLAELQARPWHNTWHPDDRPRVHAAWAESLETGRPCNFEGRRRRADGAHRWFQMRGRPLRDSDGSIILWYLLQIDIDERKRAEALLAGENRLLEMVASGQSLPAVLDALCQLVEETIDDCHCSTLLIDRDGRHVQHGAAPSLPASFNDSIHGRRVGVDSCPCAMSAHLNEQVIAADIASETRWETDGWRSLAIAHGLRACWSTPISSASGRILGVFVLYLREPGSPTPLQQSLIEQFTHVAGIAIERAQGEAALKRSEAFLAETQRLSATGGFSWRVATDEITWSAEVFRIFEVDAATPVTIGLIAGRLHPDDVPAFEEMLTRQRAHGSDFAHEHRLLMPDHSIKYLHVVASATRDREGRLEYIGAIQDVTERRLAEEALGKIRTQLAHVARVTTLGALTASIAHEVNQPLSGIVTNASTCLRMLAADPPNVDGARETARRTIRDGNRASEVVTRLRALFARKAAAIESVDLNEAAREVIALTRNELQRGRVILRPELADDLPAVTGDRVQLQQVILNLLLNASEAMSDIDSRPRQLVVRTERDDGDAVRLTVQDAGVGLDPHNADRLFEAFYTTKSAGMGIGLSVSRFIVESHRGRLWAAPNAGPGASFSFSIPREAEEAAGAHEIGAIPGTPATNPAQRMGIR